VLSAPSFDTLLFNRVIGLGLRRPATPAAVSDLVNRYRATGVRNYGIQLSPAARPEGLETWLDESGLARRDNWTKVYRPADVPPAPVMTELGIEPVAPQLADRFAEVACAGFGLPPTLAPLLRGTVGRAGWHHYMAWDRDTPVATAALFVHGDAGWLGIAATRPTHRRRGAQGALMARRLTDGAALGCRWFVTETGEDAPDRPNPSFHNMMRAGFVVAYQRPNFMPRIEEGAR
jgi:GNAT superfamily N-acetyltransferase